jgi:hypothetical protein
MKKALLSPLFCLFIVNAFAQHTSISGRLKDKENNAVVGAYVMLLGDTVLLKTALTDADGRFLFEEMGKGLYHLKASTIGYQDFISDTFQLNETKQLPDMTMQPDNKALQEVVVTSQQPFIEVLPDKIVVNVENSIVSAGGSVMDVLQRSPGVNVDNNDNISLKGKQGVVIWIDGRPTPMQGTDLATVLRSMPSGTVDKIEIISNPGAKYDAAGAAGIINIKTKKDKRFGMNGSVSLNYGQGKYPKYGAGTNLNYRKKKLNVYGNYNYAYRYWFNNLMLDRRFLDTNAAYKDQQLFRYVQDNYALYNFKNHIANAGFDYALSSKSSVGAAFSVGTNNFEPQVENHSKALDNNNALLYNFNTIGSNNNHYYNYAANLNFKHDFDSSGTTLRVDADYAAFGNNSNQNFITNYVAPNGSQFQPDYYLKSDLHGLTTIQSLKANFVHPFHDGIKMEAGLKSSFARADNNSLFYEQTDNVYALDSSRSNHFIYNENINAGYVSFSKEGKKISTQLGTRVENTNANWDQMTTGQKYDTSYVQLFPSLAAQYHLSPKQDIGLTLSRRIERPNYQQLNPFKYFIDKTTYREGYPYLKPASFYSVELSHTFDQKFVTTFTYGINKGVIVEVIQPSETEDSVTVQTNKNLKQMTFVGLSGAYPIQLTKWWNNVSNINVYYAMYQGDIANTPLHKGKPTFDLNTTNSFVLPDNYSAELGLFYQARQLYGYLDVKALWMLNVGIQKHFLHKKATLRFNIQDVFFKGYPKATSNYSGYSESFVAIRETRVANLSFVYRFGSNTVAPVRKRSGGAEEEKNRAGNGNS